MTNLPPALTGSDFDLLSPSAVQQRPHFAQIAEQFLDFLNSIPRLTDIHKVRRQPWRKSFLLGPRFDDQHWWFSHHGGRSEAQWNLGMFPCHLRFGIGFNRGGGGRPDLQSVETHLNCFLDALREAEVRRPGSITESMKCEVYNEAAGLRVMTVERLLDDYPVQDERWVFVGRLLRSGREPNYHSGTCGIDEDPEILADPAELASTLKAVAAILWEPWKQAMECAQLRSDNAE